ncbi:4-carboxymuconolactone decarboxylase [Photobacterium gaetbulicola]|uniref:4-carboxymuconolactone decarboxylase n=2 Tax=Photobacterium gaetbulicola TaxID=1295392 RepID=A0A0B9G6Z2_9GAMM|nr:4-carboxymuconolactone decarboxylase [Photobacterium gaetbulicola]
MRHVKTTLLLVLAIFYISKVSAMPTEFTDKEKAIIPIAAFTASGNIDELKVSFTEGLEAGLTINEIKEVLVQLYVYAGFPRSLNGLTAFMEVMSEREANGVKDTVGKSASPLPTDQTSLEFGTVNQTKLIGAPLSGALFDFSPQVDEYLKAHLFGDIFERDVLTWKEREIATIAALANIPGVNSQLASHYNISMNNDITPAQLQAFVKVLERKCGAAIAENAQAVLAQVLSTD